jgi:hypothetical protein
MADRKKRFRIGLVVLVAISLFVCPLAAGGFGLGGANAQIAFTPNISTLELTQTVEGPGLGTVQMAATAEPALPSSTATPVISGGSLDIGSRTYPVGDEFSDADDIRLGPSTTVWGGSSGYAVLFDHPDYRLIWYRDRNGQQHYMIVHQDDPYFSGPDGFRAQLDDYRNAVAAANTAAGGGLGGAASLGTLVALGCLGGPTCLVALTVGGVAFFGGALSEFAIYQFWIEPAYHNVVSSFELIDAHRGSVP